MLVIAPLFFWLVSPILLAQEKTPNDPYYKYQFSFHNPGGTLRINTASQRPSVKEFASEKGIDLDIQKAWEITTGSKSVVVALMDDGFCYDHPDLRDNIWNNPGEIGRDGQGFAKETNETDDDHNGFVDDVHGWDFVYDTPDVDCHIYDGMDRNRIATYPHAMGPMGIIGAKGNNGIGVAGINWNISMMLLRIGVQGTPRGENDLARVDRAVRAIHYAADNGARIINWSGFVDDPRPEKLAELRAAVEYAATKNVLVVVSAGNSAVDLDVDKNCLFPQCFDTANIVRVAEIDFEGNLYHVPPNTEFRGGSNYGLKRVEVAAIGQNFSTNVVNGSETYALCGGTSCAAPVVSGVAALMLSVNPRLTAAQLKTLLMQSVTRLPGLKDKIASEGTVNAFQAVLAAKSSQSH